MLPATPQIMLPPEVWLQVFSEFAHVPGAFSLTNHSAIEAFSEDSEGIVVHKLHCESMSTKLALSQVCWLWRKLVLPSVFEYVLIRSSAHAKVVAKALREFKNMQMSSEFYGLWINRIEVYSSDHYWDDEAQMEIVSILNNSPNITVFSDLFCPVTSNFMCPQIINKLQDLCEEGKLRRIEWYTGPPDLATCLLRGMPSLQVFVLGRSNIMPFCASMTLLPCLRIFVAGPHASPSDLLDLHAPNLQSLIMHTKAFHTARGFRPVTISFSTLHRLRLRYKDYDNAHDYLCELRTLDILNFDFGRALDFKKLSRFKHTNLKRINIIKFPLFHRSLAWHIRYGDWSVLCDFMNSLFDPRYLPSLTTIGFLIPKSYFSHGPFMTNLKKKPDGYEEFWRPWMKECKARGVKLEASLGSEDHCLGLWQPFQVNLLPRASK